MDVLHIVFLGVYIIDAHAMWYYFNQNYIIFKFIFFLEISDENQRFLKSFILFSVFFTTGNQRHSLTPFATQHIKFKS